MKITRILSVREIDSFVNELLEQGYRVFSLGTVENAQEFFRQAKEVFPLDPPLSGKVNWDAFEDSLWAGLVESADSKLALVIQDASNFRSNNEHDFRIALACLADAATGAESEKRSSGFETSDIVIAIGIC